MKKRILIIIIVLIVTGGMGYAGWHFLNNQNMGKSEEQVYVSSIEMLSNKNMGTQNRYAGVVEAQETVSISIENGRKVAKTEVQEGDVVKVGQLLFEYDLSSIEEELQEAELALERLKNEALGFEEQIRTLEAEKKKANKNNQLSYTIEIETNRMNLKKNEYDQISKAAEIEKLKSATQNTEVRSTIEGIIQKIDKTKLNVDTGDSLESGTSYMGLDSTDDSFIKILSTGAYRVKGMINELNVQALPTGANIIIRSRADETQTWKGVMGLIDRENSNSASSDSYYDMMGSGNSQTSSSTYPFYVELNSSEGLMLGQHVYIELDNGQEDSKEGVWLSEIFIVDLETDHPYVWLADDNDRLKKQEITVGTYDPELGEYEIVDGLALESYIAFPSSKLEEGMHTVIGSNEETMAAMTEESSQDLLNMEDEYTEYYEDEYTEYNEDDYSYMEMNDEYPEYNEDDYSYMEIGDEYLEYNEGDYSYMEAEENFYDGESME